MALGPAIKSEVIGESGRDREDRLRKHIRGFVDLMGQRALFLGDVSQTAARITEAAAHVLATSRVSVWLYDEARTLIRCVDLFEQGQNRHSSGTELHAKDFPVYFRALEQERTIAAHDAQIDPRTAEFAAPYLKPLDIVSMLDVPIWAGDRMVGVVCHEQVGRRRAWIADEENFGFLMANFVALAIDRR
jgi:GAF domain-containing protein